MRLLVCLLPILPYTFNVHTRWLYALIKGVKADLYFFFCNATARSIRCDGLRRICYVANTSQDVAALRKTHFAMCVYWFENTFEHFVVCVISFGGASLRRNPYVHNDCPGSAGLGNTSLCILPNVFSWSILLPDDCCLHEALSCNKCFELTQFYFLFSFF